MRWHEPTLRLGSANPNDNLRAPRGRLVAACEDFPPSLRFAKPVEQNGCEAGIRQRDGDRWQRLSTYYHLGI